MPLLKARYKAICHWQKVEDVSSTDGDQRANDDKTWRKYASKWLSWSGAWRQAIVADVFDSGGYNKKSSEAISLDKM